MKYYSFETYWPVDSVVGPGNRYDVEDWFESMRDAKAAMVESLGKLPVGSTGRCYRRYVDGDIAYPSYTFLKAAENIVKKLKH